MGQKIDVLGFKYDDSEPAFTVPAAGTHYYHLRTKKLFERVSFDAQLKRNGKAFAEGELGAPSAELVAIREDMLENIYEPSLPAVPTGFNVETGADNTQLNLSWTDASDNEAGFRIERSLDDSLYEVVVALPEGTEAWVDKDLAPATLYYYRIWSMNVSGESATYAAASATTDA